MTIEDIAAKVDSLPTLPSIVYELSRVINDPMSSTSDVEKLMSNDQSLTTKVLRLVNSAYYAIPGGVSSVSRAVAYIGFDTVNQLILSASILSALEVRESQTFDFGAFWKHAIGVAIAAETVAKFVRHPIPADLFTCGLTHDMGKVILYSFDPDLVNTICAHSEANKLTFLESELQLELPPHPVIGQLLAKKWNLPITIQTAIRYHHEKDPNRRVGLTSDQQRNVDIVLLANLLTHALKFGNSGHQQIHGAPKDIMERLTIDPQADLKKLLQGIKQGLDKASDLVRVLGGSA